MGDDGVRTVAVADLFCGAGGLSEGFRTAAAPTDRVSFRIAYGVDIDRNCMQTYRSNVLRELPEELREQRAPCRTVRGLTGEQITEAARVTDIDVLIGGPNCQAVSAAGLRNPEDARNDMFGEFVRLVEELRPRWFLLENVPGLTHRNNLGLLRQMFERLAALPGYSFAGEMLLAADQGVAQYRYRLLVLGTRTSPHVLFPPPRFLAGAAPKYRTVRDAIADLVDRSGQRMSVANHEIQRLESVNIARIGHVPQGGDWRDIPVELLPARNFATRSSDQKGTYGRLAWDSPAFTITSLAGNVTAGPFTHPELDRPLTAREAARLQGFDDDFVFAGPPESWYRQVGNAVPPPLARAVAQYILAAEAGSACVGLEGRLTVERVRDAADGLRPLPTMTPRLTPARARGSRRPLQAPSGAKRVVYDVQEATNRLEMEARLPGFMWTAKRARAVLGRRAGRADAETARDLNVAEGTVRRWVERYTEGGPEGWRAYHTRLEALADGDEQLLARLRKAIDRVREPDLAATDSSGRPHMSAYLRDLLVRYGKLSVADLKKRVSTEAGIDVGTVYVADLLAIVDVLVGALSESGAEAVG